ncbi:V-type ATPase [Wallemia mellicola]|uniref:V-type proton ATPase proteolipid subunit n=1 Tax=Wallemia mellicola TaxID=1708541 RepID=A0A4T0LVH3_9BASI|nr:V-type ATPase [Wallemia mellicola]TIC48431.1 V-type ATPase [Wallemia mellicola]
MSDQCPVFAHFLGFGGVASAMILSTIGAAYGTAKSGVGISGLATFKPELVMKSLIPIIMSGILAVYGLVVSVLIAGSLSPSEPYSLFAGCTHLAAGLACGGSGLAAGLAIGKAGDAFVRAYVYQSRVSRGGSYAKKLNSNDITGIGIIWIDCSPDIEHEDKWG